MENLMARGIQILTHANLKETFYPLHMAYEDTPSQDNSISEP